MIFLGLFIWPESRGEIRISRTLPHKFQAIILSAPVRSVIAGRRAMDAICSSGTRTREKGSGFRDIPVLLVGKRVVDVVNVDGMRSPGASSIQVLRTSFHDLRQVVLALEDGGPIAKTPNRLHHCLPTTAPPLYRFTLPNSWIFSLMRFKGT